MAGANEADSPKLTDSGPQANTNSDKISFLDLEHDVLGVIASHLTNSEKAKLALSCGKARNAIQADHITHAFIQKVLYNDQEGIKQYFEKLKSDNEEAQKIFFQVSTVIDSSGKKLKGNPYQFAYWMRNDSLCEFLEKYMTFDTKEKMKKILIDENPTETPSIFDVIHTESTETKIDETIIEDEANRRKRMRAVLRHAVLRSLVFGSAMLIAAAPGIIVSFLMPGVPLSVMICVTLLLGAVVLGGFITGGLTARDTKIAELIPDALKHANKHKCETNQIPTLAKQYQILIHSPVLRIGKDFNPIDLRSFFQISKTENKNLRIIDLSDKGINENTMITIIETINDSVHTLDLSDNPNIGNNGINQFLRLDKHFTSLSHLFLNNIGIDNNSIDSMKTILLKMKLNTLSLNKNNLNGNYCSQLIECIKAQESELRILNLADNNIHNFGVEAIASWIKTNPKLKTLDLSNNPFDDIGAWKLLEALSQNTNLECLHLPINIDSKIKEAINQKLKTNKENAVQKSYLLPN